MSAHAPRRAERRSFLRDNGLGLFFGAILLLSLAGQALVGTADYNEGARIAGLPTLTVGQYVTSSYFGVDVAENWQSEYLQFLLFILATVWLIQRGSPESKKAEDVGRESDEEQQVGPYAQQRSPAWAKASGWRRSLYSSSLGLVMGAIFLLSWGAQLVAGTSAMNSRRLQNLQNPSSVLDYAHSPEFWNRTLQNWQSEFLAVGSMVVFSIYLRERGSPESKPVGAPHDTTALEG
ncbi:MAG: DUF6766 family protein [Candidatus Phosphoribacter sp.]|nr:hypothetical protein [Actinomycetales bacterium]